MSKVDLEPETFNPLLRQSMSMWWENKTVRWYETAEFEKTTWIVPGIMNVSGTLFVTDLKHAEELFVSQRYGRIYCESIEYKKSHFTVKGLSCRYKRAYVYFAIRALGITNREDLSEMTFYKTRYPNAPTDYANLVIFNDEIAVFIAPVYTFERWWKCKVCGAYRPRERWNCKNECVRCGAIKWRALTEGEK